MARYQNRAYLEEAIPDAELSDDLELLISLPFISGTELSQNTLPEAWEEGTSSVSKLVEALVASKGIPIPWKLVVDAVNDGLSKNLFEITEGTPAQPWTVDDAAKIILQVSQAQITIDLADLVELLQQPPDESGQITLGWIKERLEVKKGGVSIPDDEFRNAVQKAVDQEIIILVDPLTSDLYKVRVKQPCVDAPRRIESHRNRDSEFG